MEGGIDVLDWSGRDKQGHLFNNPPKSEEAGSTKWVGNDTQFVVILWD